MLKDAMQILREPEMLVEVWLQRALVREYMGMITEVDTFMAGLNDKIPEAPEICTEALALRNTTQQLRRSTAQSTLDQCIIQELNVAVKDSARWQCERNV